MSPILHGLLAWLLAAALLKDVRDRRLAVIAGGISDIDGFHVLYDQALYNDYHHTFGHTLLFGIPVALCLALAARDRKQAFLVSLGTFSLHLLADIAGTSWPVFPFYPLFELNFSMGHYLSEATLDNVVVPATWILVLLLMAAVMFKKEISPLEFFSAKLDARFTGLYIYPFKYSCHVCRSWAFICCAGCEKKVCPEHIGSLSSWQCSECLEKEKTETLN